MDTSDAIFRTERVINFTNAYANESPIRATSTGRARDSHQPFTPIELLEVSRMSEPSLLQESAERMRLCC